MSIRELARQINTDCLQYRYFWACGLVKDTASLWTGERMRLLCGEARMMARHYQGELKAPQGA